MSVGLTETLTVGHMTWKSIDRLRGPSMGEGCP